MIRVEAFSNESTNRFVRYLEGDELRLIWHSSLPMEMVWSDPIPVLEGVFRYLNRDDRPNRGFARSLSSGDIITLSYRNRSKSYAVEPVGFRQLELVRRATPQQKGYITKRLKEVKRDDDERRAEATGSGGRERGGAGEDHREGA